jgi:hypothetical protein
VKNNAVTIAHAEGNEKALNLRLRKEAAGPVIRILNIKNNYHG